MKNCPDCNVKPGEIHIPGCDIEQCPACGGQRLSCDCETTLKPLPWTGEFPGTAECREFGWYSYLDSNGWQRCDKDHPKAGEDLNRLYEDAQWNANLGRFVLKSKAKLITIHYCTECPHMKHASSLVAAFQCVKLERHLKPDSENFFPIPDDCPLKDEKEAK
jgi:hypothetical protein